MTPVPFHVSLRTRPDYGHPEIPFMPPSPLALRHDPDRTDDVPVQPESGSDDPGPTTDCLVGRREALRRMLLSLKLGLTWDEINDILQETMYRGWRALHSGRAIQLKDRWAWLRRVAKNVAIDYCRSRSRRICLSIEDFEPEDPKKGIPILVLQKRIRDAVDTLPPPLKQIVELRYLEGETYASLRTLLGLSDGAITRLLEKAKAILQERLADLE